MRGNSHALFGKRPTEKDPAKGTSPAVHFTRREAVRKRPSSREVNAEPRRAAHPTLPHEQQAADQRIRGSRSQTGPLPSAICPCPRIPGWARHGRRLFEPSLCRLALPTGLDFGPTACRLPLNRAALPPRPSSPSATASPTVCAPAAEPATRRPGRADDSRSRQALRQQPAPAPRPLERKDHASSGVAYLIPFTQSRSVAS